LLNEKYFSKEKHPSELECFSMLAVRFVFRSSILPSGGGSLNAVHGEYGLSSEARDNVIPNS
jgi:hypothetical protein